MQVEEQVVGTFLLQKVEPVTLHGALTAITSGKDRGWVLVAFSGSSASCSYQFKGDSMNISMEFDVALRFATALLVLASVDVPMLQEEESVNVGAVEITGPPRQKKLNWTPGDKTLGLKVASSCGNVELRLESRLAAAVAFRIVRAAGQVSASK